MGRRKIEPFHVIVERHGEFKPYDIMEHLVRTWKREKWKYEKRPETFKELEGWVKRVCKYNWWAQTEWEIILQDWPCQNNSVKWDVYTQIEMNLPLILKIFVENIGFIPHKAGSYIVLEKFPGPSIVTDSNGEVLMFDDICDATEEANICQNGMVINLKNKN